MWTFWHHLPEKIDPVFIQLGNFEVRYYSLMYLVGFLVAYFYLLHRLKKKKRIKYKKDLIQDFLIVSFIALVVGGRIGYFLFYNFKVFYTEPLRIFGFSNGQFSGFFGMSFHGGALAVLITAILFCWKRRINFWNLADFIIPAVPLGFTFGRMGNFLNGELYGRITTVPWGMYFPFSYDFPMRLRHPSQLYEALFEGVFLFLIILAFQRLRKYFKEYNNKTSKKTEFLALFPFRKRLSERVEKRSKKDKKASFKFRRGYLLFVYLFFYSVIRFILEFFREPDAHLGFVFWKLSMGQVLSLVLIGACLTCLFVLKCFKIKNKL